MSKVHLFLVDGMRPDALSKCSNPFIRELLDRSLYSLNAQTVFPSVTLPCHMSLIHSVDPDRHGVTTNTYTPQVRPIKGLFEMVSPTKTTAFSYNWEELRDLSRPGSLTADFFCRIEGFGGNLSNNMVTDASIGFVRQFDPDFLFTYLGWTDEEGHGLGWMTPEYLHTIDESFDSIRRLMEVSDEDTISIITADHGGHARSHGTTMPEDMTIPIIICGKGVTPGVIDRPVTIKDIAPTITKILGCPNAPEWEGTSIL